MDCHGSNTTLSWSCYSYRVIGGNLLTIDYHGQVMTIDYHGQVMTIDYHGQVMTIDYHGQVMTLRTTNDSNKYSSSFVSLTNFNIFAYLHIMTRIH